MKNGLRSHLNGNFKYCLKGQCEQSCCDPKNFLSDSVPHCAYETLDIHNQAEKINEKIGKEIIKVDMWAKNMTGCLQDNKCLFEENRPATCKIFPLRIYPDNPIKGEVNIIKLGIRDKIQCPQVEMISHDIEFVINTIEFLSTFFECKVELTGALKEIETAVAQFYEKAL